VFITSLLDNCVHTGVLVIKVTSVNLPQLCNPLSVNIVEGMLLLDNPGHSVAVNQLTVGCLTSLPILR
jgi:hypothetical protein